MATLSLCASKPSLQTLGQVGLLSMVWLSASALSSRFLPALPAGVLGMLLVLAALWSGLLPLSWCKRGAGWLLAEMLLFFIPSVVAVVQYPELVMSVGLRIVAVIVLSTLLVMAATSSAVEACYRLELSLRRTGSWWSAPILLVPLLVIALVLLADVPYRVYFEDTRWLTWLLGPATVAFAVPIYEQRKLIGKHWLSLSCGVLVGMPVAVLSSVWLARLFNLSELLQKSLAPRSISTPFAVAASHSIGAAPDLTAVFVVMTGVFGMLAGEAMLALLPIRSRLAKGALYGAAAHGAGSAKAAQLGAEEGVVASLTMMLGGLATVLAAPLIAWIV